MTFNLVRGGWPNIVPILALVLMPVAGLATTLDRAPRAAKIAMTEYGPQPDALLPIVTVEQVLK
ncbi:MAG: hypothetical protein K2Z80_22930 [Xanthobacteraceae bacterium]|nr:hypothetical protein [Xanthobacteraceae bacterium]